MSYNEEFWNKYSDENESRYNEEFAKFVRDLATSLHCASVLEVGCGTGIDLRLFPDTFQFGGIDLNDHALDIAKEKVPNGNFKNGTITNLPFEDSSIDFVFTHGLMNYLDDDKLDEIEKQIDENQKSRNMKNRWINYKVRFVSNVDMHEDIEPDKPRFTLLKKL